MPRRSDVPHRRAEPWRRRRLTLTLTAALTLGTTAALGLPAHGATPQEQLAAKQAQAKQLLSQIQANADKEGALDEQMLVAQQAIASAQEKISQAQRGIVDAQKRVIDVRSKLGLRAARLYMGFGSDDPFQLNVGDVQQLASRSKYNEAAASHDQQLIDELRLATVQLDNQRRDLETQKSDAQRQQHTLEVARKDLEKTSATLAKLQDQNKGDIATLTSQIQQQQEEAARQATLARLNSRRATQGVRDTGVDPGNIPAPSAGAAAAVAYARAQVGKPYQYAGVGPGSYDCSGLVMMAWAQGGVGMPHGSQAQYNMFPHVPISALQPGDIVFFGSSGPGNHHDGIYVGGGTMIEAPHTGAYVRYASIYRPDLVPLGARP